MTEVLLLCVVPLIIPLAWDAVDDRKYGTDGLGGNQMRKLRHLLPTESRCTALAGWVKLLMTSARSGDEEGALVEQALAGKEQRSQIEFGQDP